MKQRKDLTEFGKAVRKFRIEAGVKLGEHADYINKSLSLLSGVETGTKRITEEVLGGTIRFFETHGIDASCLRDKAKYSASEHTITWTNFPENDKRLFDCFATELPNLSEHKKKQIWKVLSK